jgi:secreted PhoX family phosphatase
MSRHDGLEPEDLGTNPSSNPTFESILQQRYSRRELLRTSFGVAIASTFGGLALVGCGGDGGGDDGGGNPNPTPLTLGFGAVAKSIADAVSVPAGYTVSVLYSLGDPIEIGRASCRERVS